MGQGRFNDKESERLLKEWHARFRMPLLKFFERRTRPDIDREDLVQEVFARLIKRDDLSSVDNVDGYVFQTASSVLTDHLRRRRVRPHDNQVPLEDDDYVSDEALSPERVILGKEAIEQLGRALAELPERAQTVFALYHFEEVPQTEIAKRMGVSLSTVEKEIAKTNHFLLKKLKGWL